MNPLSIEAQVLRDLGPAQTVFAAAAAGFDMAGIWIDPAVWTSATTRAVRHAFKECGVRPLDAEVIRISGRHLDENHLKLIDIAGEIGAQHVIVVSLTSDVAATIASLAALAEHASRAGTALSLEFAPFSAVATAEAALKIIASAGPSIGLLPDPLHLCRSGGLPSDIGKLPAERVHFAQICDAALLHECGTPEALLWEARFDRCPLGAGRLPIAEYFAALPPGVAISDETRSLKFEERYPDPYERARILAQRLRACVAGWTAGQ